jgi:flagellar M-ring protein FliF
VASTLALPVSLQPALMRWQALPRGARLGLGLALGMLVLAVLLWSSIGGREEQVLFSNLAPEDLEAVRRVLDRDGVPYRVGEAGRVLVPASQVHELRLRLAGQGLPSGGTVGFELFDRTQLGLTDFTQRLAFRRALEGELARTISQLRAVDGARVHLALPEPRLFEQDQRSPSASVVLRLRPGARLAGDEVRAIVHLVSAAVEGLSADRVTVIDAAGRLLVAGDGRAEVGGSALAEARLALEQELERRVESLLVPIVGSGGTAVRVSASLNPARVERTQERFADPTPRSQQRTTELTQGTSTQPTAVATSEPPAQPPAPSSATTRTQRQQEQTTFEVGRTVERVVIPPGAIERLTVAVLLDVPIIDGRRAPRPDAELERLRRLVASAVGLRTDRQDELEIQQVAFDWAHEAPAAAPAPPVSAWPRWRWPALGVLAALLLAVVALALSRRRGRPRTVPAPAGPAPGPTALGGQPPAAVPAAPESPAERLRRAAAERPQRVAEVVRRMLREHEGEQVR